MATDTYGVIWMQHRAGIDDGQTGTVAIWHLIDAITLPLISTACGGSSTYKHGLNLPGDAVAPRPQVGC